MSSGDIDIEVTSVKAGGSEYSSVTSDTLPKDETGSSSDSHGDHGHGSDDTILKTMWNSTLGLVFNTGMYVKLNLVFNDLIMLLGVQFIFHSVGTTKVVSLGKASSLVVESITRHTIS